MKMVRASEIRVGDHLLWDETVTDAKPAKVLKTEQRESTVTITYVNRQGELDSYSYDANEQLKVAE